EQASAAAALEQLMMLAPFDIVETDGQLRAVLHGAGQEVIVTTNEAAATNEVTSEPAPLITQSRTQELDLPLELGIDYLDATRDYEIGSQRARRTASRGVVTKVILDLPLVTTASTAKQLAQRHLYATWIERDRMRLVLSRKWIGIEPSDVVVFDGKRIRVLSVTMKEGLIQIDGVAAVPDDLQGSASADNGSAISANLSAQVATSLYLMDLPLLRNEDDQPGVYVAASALDGWKGATLWRAADGVNFTCQTSFTVAATAGVTACVLAQASPLYCDRASTVRVQLLHGSLSSCTFADLLNGANAALCGGEVLQFQTATLVGPNLYELGVFLRGRKGTESATASHVMGENFVVLSEATLQYLPAQLTDRNVAYHFRAVSNGGSLDLARDVTFAYAARSQAPFAPAHLRGQRVAGSESDLAISWVRRARKNAQWVDYIDVPLDETEELYDVEILNESTVVRTFANVTSSHVTYTSAQQVADWGSVLPAAYTVKVYQLSASYGRGNAITRVL
ncbi:MAG: phage tail protein, partial [Alphaproteobacteria bacterium]|nr:phage tail protein [Alphaproteobacteria bacterium]